jgi:transposase-like protein
MLSLKEELEQALDAARRAKAARRCGAKLAGSHSELIRTLERAGYHLSRNSRRATCPTCSTGRTDFVVSVNLDKAVYYCHRCNRGAKIQNLAPAFQLGQPKPRIRRADIKKRQFREWLDSRMTQLADCERRLARRALWASQALKLGVGWPVSDLVWLVLGDFYQAQRTFETFWQDATDKCGRLELYRRWRRGRG